MVFRWRLGNGLGYWMLAWVVVNSYIQNGRCNPLLTELEGFIKERVVIALICSL